jgi:hypothetical protein
MKGIQMSGNTDKAAGIANEAAEAKGRREERDQRWR